MGGMFSRPSVPVQSQPKPQPKPKPKPVVKKKKKVRKPKDHRKVVKRPADDPTVLAGMLGTAIPTENLEQKTLGA